jgi:hypothetical protein
MNEKVFLIGNDINNATSDYSWQNLLEDLVDYARVSNKTSFENKPFPLLYEEIFLNSARAYGANEERIKSYIAAKARRLKPNKIHELVINSGVKNILTTNYDLAFERVTDKGVKKITNKGVIKESSYSLFRTNNSNGAKLWHIHGCLSDPRSIMLGYEHYSGYLQTMRNYVVTGTKSTYKSRRYNPIPMRLMGNQITYDSWIDFFFSHDIEIFGLNLDFVEMHLWWLLTYRARAMVTGEINIKNQIRYYYPSKFRTKSKHKLELFKANGVETIGILMKDDNRLDYYERVIKRIKGRR